jgi:pSer/pThr/pTyr-binding forkhead associated (FHA) protein
VPTRLESVDDIRAALLARHAEMQGGEPAAPPAADPRVAHASGSSAAAAGPALPKTVDMPTTAAAVRLFKPSLRPPMALLTVLDDGDDEGEIVRVRGERFVIGRTEGDLQLPHDGQVSGRHAEIVRRREDSGAWVWGLADLGSTNGTFVRVGSAVLRDGQEFLIGRTRYRFDEHGPPVPESAEPAAGSAKSTVSWNADAGLPGVPSVVELTRHGLGSRVTLLQAEYWIGSDRSACAVVPADDPFVSPRHAKISRDHKGRWQVANNRSVNGVWVRIDHTDLASSCYFQVGEQRFSFKVPQP